MLVTDDIQFEHVCLRCIAHLGYITKQNNNNKKTPKICAGNGFLEESPGNLEIEAVLASV